MKPYDVEIMDLKTGEILSGYLVFANSQLEARLKAHFLDPIAEDKDMSKYMVWSTCEFGKPETKKTYFSRMKDEESGTDVTVCS